MDKMDFDIQNGLSYACFLLLKNMDPMGLMASLMSIIHCYCEDHELEPGEYMKNLCSIFNEVYQEIDAN